MTNEEALKRMKAMIKCTDCTINRGLNCEECVEIAYLCIEKQIPKKIKKQLYKEYCSSDCWWPDSDHADTWNEKEGYWLEEHSLCPVCKEDFGSSFIDRIEYCPHCGQALDWSNDA